MSALDGVRVLDLTAGLAGPVAGMLLADLGADVVKIRPPGGGPSAAEPGLHVWDRGKRAAVLDRTHPGELRALDRFERRCDRQPAHLAAAEQWLVGLAGAGGAATDVAELGEEVEGLVPVGPAEKESGVALHDLARRGFKEAEVRHRPGGYVWRPPAARVAPGRLPA